MAKRHTGSTADDITPAQYEQAWTLYRTAHRVQQICTAVGLTRSQVNWLVATGDAARKMPAFAQRMAEEVAAIRTEAIEAAKQVSASGLEAIRENSVIASDARKICSSVIKAHALYAMRPILENLQQGQLSPAEAQAQVAKMAMPRELRETLRVLKPYADWTETAKAFRMVYGEATTAEPGPPTPIIKDLPLDAVLPASVSLVDVPDGVDGVTGDPLDDLVPELAEMTDEQIDHYVSTGEFPGFAYGEEDE